MAIGKNVQALRERRGLTYDTVAKAVGTDPQAISQMEKRDSKTSTFAIELAAFFSVDLVDLMSEEFDVDQALAKRQPEQAPMPAAQLQWVTPEEGELLSLFRACGGAEQGTVMSIVRSLPKAVMSDGIRSSNKPEPR